MMETLNQKAPSLPFDFVSLQLQYLVLHLPETKESFQINLTIKKVTTLLTAILKLKLRLISNGYLKQTFGKTPGHALFVCLFVSSFDTVSFTRKIGAFEISTAGLLFGWFWIL